ncbi:hypothetical protein M0R04_04995 [Candidatus Dojkabacteria bacterium]|jgi:hypothetical protein|nr:hypothetical protein [Candidatus Dojkabacteria bacterium]
MKPLRLQRKDIVKIKKILDQFIEVDDFDLKFNQDSGIGYSIDMSFERSFTMGEEKVTGRLVVPISGVEDW